MVLERNLCFVDTTLGSSTSRTGQIHAIAQYMRQQLARAVAAVNSSNNDLQNLLGGNGGSQVDAVLYLISQGMVPTLRRFVTLAVLISTVQTLLLRISIA